MDIESLKKLKTGLEEEIKSYDSMLRISLKEKDVLSGENFPKELISLASKKHKLINRINAINSKIDPLKALWVQEREMLSASPMEKEIAPLISRLGNILDELMTVDRNNMKKLSDMTEADWNKNAVKNSGKKAEGAG